jgi:hypothetical protein
MLRNRDRWITISLANLCVVPLLGALLRTLFLFDIPSVDYKSVLSAHSHFAFGGWVTLALMILFIDKLLPHEAGVQQKYQVVLWGIQLSAAGMVLTFPATGYGILAIIFSTLFIFFTYGFTWIFIRDFLRSPHEKSVTVQAVSALIFLAISSIGPWTLAYVLATKSASHLYRDAIYTFLHFQYNGYFTLGVFALFYNHIVSTIAEPAKKEFHRFTLWLAASIVPSLFLSLTWHRNNGLIYVFASIGTLMIVLTLFYFIRFLGRLKTWRQFTSGTAHLLLVFAMASFSLKLILQVASVVPQLSTMVFGYRPIIIGFLHLVFLGFVTFYLLAHFIEIKTFDFTRAISKYAILLFALGIILNETILMIQGAGLMMSTAHPAYAWLLWAVSLLMFAGAVLIFVARIKSVQGKTGSASRRVY